MSPACWSSIGSYVIYGRYPTANCIWKCEILSKSVRMCQIRHLDCLSNHQECKSLKRWAGPVYSFKGCLVYRYLRCEWTGVHLHDLTQGKSDFRLQLIVIASKLAALYHEVLALDFDQCVPSSPFSLQKSRWKRQQIIACKCWRRWRRLD